MGIQAGQFVRFDGAAVRTGNHSSLDDYDRGVLNDGAGFAGRRVSLFDCLENIYRYQDASETAYNNRAEKSRRCGDNRLVLSYRVCVVLTK